MDLQEMPPEARIWQLALGYANTAVLFNLVKTGIIEQMREQPRSLSEIASNCHLNQDALYRFLRYADVIGLVAVDDSQYHLTEVGRLLLQGVPGSMFVGIQLFGNQALQDTWRDLDYSLSTGDSAFSVVNGTSFFDYLKSKPQLDSIFNEWMTISTSAMSKVVSQTYDFTPYTSVCDIGGGQGELLKVILTDHPNLSGILYDQPSVVKNHILSGMDGRAQVQSGSFFDWVPSADVLILKSIIHDWSDEKSQAILKQCRRAMKPDARVVIIDRVIGSSADFMGAFFDLHMMILAGGKERTRQDFDTLLMASGLHLNRIIPTQTPWQLIEAVL